VTAGEDVLIIDPDPDRCALARGLDDVSVRRGDATDAAVLRKAGADHAKCVIAATDSDETNLRVCEVARAQFGVPRLIARANTEASIAALEAAGAQTLSPSRAAATVLENMALRPNLFRLLVAGVRSDHVAEVRVTRPQSVGKTIAELSLRGCLVVVLRRGDALIAPRGSTVLRGGDELTLLGSAGEIGRIREQVQGKG
jgi:trk system potassium uptake protein TrkA